jgi:arylsulfatase A-like enzyme
MPAAELTAAIRVALAVLLSVCAGRAWAAQAAAPARPNFLFLIADDVSWDDCGAFGNPHVRTPAIDRLSAQGMRFTHAFVTASSCSPSRASILTGRYPHATGAANLHDPLSPEQNTFAKLLRRAGYYVAAAGKWHLGQPAVRTFDRVRQQPGRFAEAVDECPRDRPFCLWLGFFEAHRPFQRSPGDDRHKPVDAVVPPHLPDVEETREELAAYYDEIARMDAEIERVLERLERRGAARNTVVVFIGDNGRPFPRSKTTVYDSGIRVPLIVRWPAGLPAGATCDALVSAVDLAPTVAELAGIGEGTGTFQGRSMAPLFRRPSAEIRPAVFAERNWHDFADCGRAVRTRTWKYVRNAETASAATPPADVVRGATFQAMRRLRREDKLTPAQQVCFLRPRPAEELYDLDQDPDELHNVAGDPSVAKSLAEMRARLDRWTRETGDDTSAPRRPDEFDRETGRRLQADIPAAR